mgnify:CR=1 FL=1
MLPLARLCHGQALSMDPEKVQADAEAVMEFAKDLPPAPGAHGRERRTSTGTDKKGPRNEILECVRLSAPESPRLLEGL